MQLSILKLSDFDFKDSCLVWLYCFHGSNLENLAKDLFEIISNPQEEFLYKFSLQEDLCLLVELAHEDLEIIDVIIELEVLLDQIMEILNCFDIKRENVKAMTFFSRDVLMIESIS